MESRSPRMSRSVMVAVPVFALALGMTAGAQTPASADPPHAHIRVNFVHGKLAVIGSNKDDTIRIVRRAHSIGVRIDGHKISFAKAITPSRLKRIKVRGRQGNDTIILVEQAGPLPRARLQGGQGNDLIKGGS